MPRPSRLQGFLASLPESQRNEIEQEILKCRDAKTAFQFLKNCRGYLGSYDSVLSWRRSRLNRDEFDQIAAQSSKLTNMAATIPLETDPISSAMCLAQQLSFLCSSLTAMLLEHQWLLEQDTLTNQQATKILSILPSLMRASAGTILEMSKAKDELDQKVFALALFEELSRDWQQALSADNPELVGLFESVSKITKARLELDRPSVLEQQLKNSEPSVSNF